MFLKAQWMTFLLTSALAGMTPANGRLEIFEGPQPPGHARRELSVQWRPETGRAVAIQFNVECAPGWRMEIALGRDALAAGKQLVSSDLPSGGKRLLIFGMEPLELAEGELAMVTAAPAVERPAPLWVEAREVLAVNREAVTAGIGAALYGDAEGAHLVALKDALAVLDAGEPLYTRVSCGPDVNGDGAVTVADLQTLAGMTAADAPARCDLDGDGRLTRADFRLLVRAVISAGLKRN